MSKSMISESGNSACGYSSNLDIEKLMIIINYIMRKFFNAYDYACIYSGAKQSSIV